MSDQLTPKQAESEFNFQQAVLSEKERQEEDLLLGPAVNLSPPLVVKHSPKTIKQILYQKKLISENILPIFGPSRYQEKTEAEAKILQSKLEPMDLPLPIFAKFLNLKKGSDEKLDNDETMEIDPNQNLDSPKGIILNKTIKIQSKF